MTIRRTRRSGPVSGSNPKKFVLVMIKMELYKGLDGVMKKCASASFDREITSKGYWNPAPTTVTVIKTVIKLLCRKGNGSMQVGDIIPKTTRHRATQARTRVIKCPISKGIRYETV